MHNGILRRSYGIRPRDRVLDIGCGAGQTTRDAARLAVAGSHHVTAERFDVAISRFGTIFFTDPVAGFTNIARAMRPNGRLVMMVWQVHHRNEWSVSIQLALTAGGDVPIPSPGAPDPFSLADPATTERVLEAAGFSYVNDVLQRLDRASTERVREQLIQTLAAHARGDGVWFDSSAWIVTARRR